MPAQSPISYVQQYGRQLLGRQAPQRPVAALGGAPAPAGGGALDQVQTFGMDNAPAAPALRSSGPQATGALEMNDAASQPQKSGSDFWSLAEQTPDSDKEKIADTLDSQFKKGGTDLETVFNQKAAAGDIKTPAAVGQKFDRKQMGLYLLELGLRMAQRSAQGESTIGAAAGGALDIMNNGRANAAAEQSRQDKLGESAADRADREAERTARANEGEKERKDRAEQARLERESRETEGDKDRTLRRDLNTADNATRMRVERMQKGDTRQTFIDEDGQVYWKDTQEPVMVKDAKTGESKPLKSTVRDNSGQVTEKQVLEEANKIRAKYDGDVTARVTIDGNNVAWRSLTEPQKAQYIEQIKASMRSKTPDATGKNAFDQFD